MYRTGYRRNLDLHTFVIYFPSRNPYRTDCVLQISAKHPSFFPAYFTYYTIIHIVDIYDYDRRKQEDNWQFDKLHFHFGTSQVHSFINRSYYRTLKQTSWLGGPGGFHSLNNSGSDLDCSDFAQYFVLLYLLYQMDTTGPITNTKPIGTCRDAACTMEVYPWHDTWNSVSNCIQYASGEVSGKTRPSSQLFFFLDHLIYLIMKVQ